MKFSYQWMRELIPGLNTEPAELQRLITMKTAECEGIEPFGLHFATVLAARVLTVQPLSKGKNKVVSIEIGGGVRKQVVCGAPNVRPGLIAAWVPPGTSLGDRMITTAVIDGTESEGMLASPAELGINRDHSELLEVHGAHVGAVLPDLAPDWIIEIDNKSLTHRPDLWGHYGMAREVAAITQRGLVDPVDPGLLPAGPPSIEVSIADFGLFPRYSALALENVRVVPSPLWLQARLESIGLNTINNVVDVTNFILAELPQPMHAFDADKLRGNKICIRLARSGERLAALNGETYDLHPADLVIADASGPIAIAGVIGGAPTAISESTTRIVLESANFQAASVRLTSSRHKLRTDASIRFEKSLDPANTVRGLARAIALLREVSPGIHIPSGVSDLRSETPSLKPVALPVDFVTRKLGKQVTAQYISGILGALGFGVTETAHDLLTVSIPSWRATKDISHKQDLVEEVGRIIGYDQIKPEAPLVASVVPPSDPMRLYLRRLRSRLAAQGFTEVHNYSFIEESEAKRFSFDIATHIAVRNPIASELTHLRQSLLPGLFKNIASNVRHAHEFRLFEIGNEIRPAPDGGLPDEVPHLAAAIYNSRGDEQDFFELKRVVDCLFASAYTRPAEARPFEHPVRTAEVLWHENVIGRLFELHPSVLMDSGIDGRAVFFDADLRLAGRTAARDVRKYTPLRKYPTSGFDLSVLAARLLPVAEIEIELTRLAGASLVFIDFVRQYAGPPLPEGQKSVSYHLEIGALDHTLTTDETNEVRSRIIEGMQALGYELRI